MRITGGLYCERADFTENGCFLPRTGGLCQERVDFCRERAIRFPGVTLVRPHILRHSPEGEEE